jgi:selenide,water dikinase
MGGRPITALNVVAFPDNELDLAILQEILRGGSERVAAAGASIAGGHSIRDKGILYGLSVTGVVDPAKMMTNAAARPGDALVLTKALGTGFVTTALRARACPDELLAAATASMIRLNDTASAAAVALGARAATDITGYGLAGHAMHMAEASGVTIAIDVAALPQLPGAADLVRKTHFSRANKSNREHVEPHLRIEGGATDPAAIEFLHDPQTSGGLLVAIAASRCDELIGRCRRGGLADTAVIGTVLERDRRAGDVRLIART